MDWINQFLNITAIPLTLISLCLLLPPYLIFKSIRFIANSIFFTEDLSKKVILITGASSGIGEYLAYEYARRGACLALTARREPQLRKVADQCLSLGSPDVIVIRADVSEVEDCKRMVDGTVAHFGKLDHLVNNAGISHVGLFEDCEDITALKPLMDINIWGYVYPTKFAIPHLRRSKGKIVVVSSVTSWITAPQLNLYNASKAASLALFESLRLEFYPDVGVTIVTPGFVESELTQGKWEKQRSDLLVSWLPLIKTERCAKVVVDGVCRGDRYVTEPAWMKVTQIWKMFLQELIDHVVRLLCTVKRGEWLKAD